jgi:hypothetical protein
MTWIWGDSEAVEEEIKAAKKTSRKEGSFSVKPLPW